LSETLFYISEIDRSGVEDANSIKAAERLEKMIVQIYEIQTPFEAEKCLELGVDHIGSVLLSKDSWRLPALKDVIRLTKEAGAKSSLIPLFEEPGTIFSVIDYYEPRYIHLCGTVSRIANYRIRIEEIVRFQSELKEKFPDLEIIRSIPVPQDGKAAHFSPLELAQALEPVSDLFLADTWVGSEPVEGFIGITGKTSNWELVRKLVYKSKIPVILAGGLSPENVRAAIEKVVPAGVDSCTQTNLVDKMGHPIRFRKDFKRVERFVKEARMGKPQESE
jgi:phosphoribosylanthranilate isomerase